MSAITPSHSAVYFLDAPKEKSSFFQPYFHLIQQFAEQGEFLNFENHLEWLKCYAHDAQALHTQYPLLVFRPYTTTVLAPFIAACAHANLPVTVRGAGTGLVGSCIASQGGIILLTGHFKQILAFDSLAGQIHVEPGVTIRQLNQAIEKEGWFFPLSMATEGVASLAGCLSCRARGYHQQKHSFLSYFQEVTLIDGAGKPLTVPAALVSGAEGLLGVIQALRLQLQRLPAKRLYFSISCEWEALMPYLDEWRGWISLDSLTWNARYFTFCLAGDSWRVTQASARLMQQLPAIQAISEAEWRTKQSLLPVQSTFMDCHCALAVKHLPAAIQAAQTWSCQLNCTCLMQADICAGSLHLILQPEKQEASFVQTAETFLVSWADYLDQQQGELVTCHGVGKQMAPYLSPFWNEETRMNLQKLQEMFDPQGLWKRERFFPIIGKSLEKVYGKTGR